MEQKDLILAALSCAPDHKFTPVQVQKLFFLIDKKLAHRLDGPYFDFKPYDYGPFDAAVYSSLTDLAGTGSIFLFNTTRPRTYQLTPEGSEAGLQILQQLESNVVENIRKLTLFVISLSFANLVSAIYKEYPEMREKSVFQG
jgi:uncharacterized protein